LDLKKAVWAKATSDASSSLKLDCYKEWELKKLLSYQEWVGGWRGRL
jgi:hypothetical protein